MTLFFMNMGQHPRTLATIEKSIVPAAEDLATTIQDIILMA